MKIESDDLGFLALSRACEVFQDMFLSREHADDITNMAMSVGSLRLNEPGWIGRIPEKLKQEILKTCYNCKNMEEIIDLGCLIHRASEALKQMKVPSVIWMDDMIILNGGDVGLVPSAKIRLPSVGQMKILLVAHIILECMTSENKTKAMMNVLESDHSQGFYMFADDIKAYMSDNEHKTAMIKWSKCMKNDKLDMEDIITLLDKYSNTRLMCVLKFLGCRKGQPFKSQYQLLLKILSGAIGTWNYCQSRSYATLITDVMESQLNFAAQDIYPLMLTIEWLRSKARVAIPDGNRLERVATDILHNLTGSMKYINKIIN